MTIQPEPLLASEQIPLAARPERSTPDLDAAELAWWEEYSDIEERFCWVQTPTIQRIIRGEYVRRIARAIPRESHVLEVGCGTGWLSLLLAEYAAAHVHGVDFSTEQIRRATAAARERRPQGSVQFHRVQNSLEELVELVPDQRFDAMVIHGVIHHLAKVEIRALMETFSRHLAAPNARIFVLEPVLYPRPAADRMQWFVDRLADRLIHLPMTGQRIGFRKKCPRELETQQQINRRSTYPTGNHGPSPKERPFLPGEIEDLLGDYLAVRRKSHVLAFSYHAAKNLLLTELSHPRLTRVLLRPYLQTVRGIEKWMLAQGRFPLRLPVFELLECELIRTNRN